MSKKIVSSLIIASYCLSNLPVCAGKNLFRAEQMQGKKVQSRKASFSEKQEIDFSNQGRSHISGPVDPKMLWAALTFLLFLRPSEAAPKNRPCSADMDSINFSDFLKVRVDLKQSMRGSFGSLGLSPECLHEFSGNTTLVKNLTDRFATKAMQVVHDCIQKHNFTVSEKKSINFAKRNSYSHFTFMPNITFDPVERTFSAFFGKTYYEARENLKLSNRTFGLLGIYNRNSTGFYLQLPDSSVAFQRVDGNALNQTQARGIMIMKGVCFVKSTSFTPEASSSFEFLNSDVAKATGIGIAGIAASAIITTLLIKKFCRKKAPESGKLSCEFKNGASPRATIKTTISKPTPVPMPKSKLWGCAVGSSETGFSSLIESSSSEDSCHDPDYVEMNSGARATGSGCGDLKSRVEERAAYPLPHPVSTMSDKPLETPMYAEINKHSGSTDSGFSGVESGNTHTEMYSTISRIPNGSSKSPSAYESDMRLREALIEKGYYDTPRSNRLLTIAKS